MRIEAVGIDDIGSFWVKPATATFPYIYREAVEVHWDAEQRRLLSPKPRNWSYLDWFKQIRDATREQGVRLTFGRATRWSNIDDDLRQTITAAAASD